MKNILAFKSAWSATEPWTQSMGRVHLWMNVHVGFPEVLFQVKIKCTHKPELSAIWLLLGTGGFLLTTSNPACPLSHMCFPCKLPVTCQNWSGSFRSSLSDRLVWTQQCPISGSVSHTVWNMMSLSPCSHDGWLHTKMMLVFECKKKSVG